MLVDFQVRAMRVMALFSHFLLTTGLYWTKFDSIQVAMENYKSDSEFLIANQQYVGMISFSLISLLFQVVVLGLAPDHISLMTMLHLAADCSACFWISWIILDGLDWHTYIYIFVFCVMLPTTWDMCAWAAFIFKKQSLGWKKPKDGIWGLIIASYFKMQQFFNTVSRRR